MYFGGGYVFCTHVSGGGGGCFQNTAIVHQLEGQILESSHRERNSARSEHARSAHGLTAAPFLNLPSLPPRPS